MTMCVEKGQKLGLNPDLVTTSNHQCSLVYHMTLNIVLISCRTIVRNPITHIFKQPSRAGSNMSSKKSPWRGPAIRLRSLPSIEEVVIYISPIANI